MTFFFKRIYFQLCACVWGYVQVGTGAHRGQKRVLDSLELKLWVFVRCRTWVLGTQLGLYKNSMYSHH